MRGKVNIAAALAISVFAALSCSEREEPKKLNESILFNVAVSPATKAEEGSDAVYPTDTPFAVWAEGSDGTVLLDNTPCELTDRSYPSEQCVLMQCGTFPDPCITYRFG